MKNKSKKTVLITGGTGFIGTNLLSKLIKDGYEITLLVRPGESLNEYPKNVKTREEDLINGVFSAEALGGVDVIIHLAGLADIDESLRGPAQHIKSNLNMLFSMLEAARLADKKPLFIFASTDRSYGKTEKKIVDETEPTFPIEPYTSSKILGEKIIETYHYLYDIPYIIFRIDSVFGPGQPSRMFISDIIKKMLRGEEIITGGLDIKKNFLYVDDLAAAFISAIESSVSAQNNIYNVGGVQYSLKEVLLVIDKMMEKKTGRKNSLTIKEASIRRSSKNEVRSFVLSTEKIKKNLNWSQRNALEEGIENTINYFASQYEKKD